MPQFKKFPGSDTKSSNAALLIHGGCFTDGDESWNSEQANSIATSCGLDVFTLNFSTNSYAQSIRDIKHFFTELSKAYSGQVGLIGCSSGGFLALNVLKEVSLPLPLFVVLICPVMHPEKREALLVSTGASNAASIRGKQQVYFKEKPYPTPYYGTRSQLTIIAAKDDENVPLSLIESEAKRYRDIQLHVLEGTHSLSYKSSAVVNELVSDCTRAKSAANCP
jgi:acetyl esterase/lipase